MGLKKIPVTLYNKEGISLDLPSKMLAARTLNVSLTTIDNRLKDGYPILKEGCRGIYVKLYEGRN